MVGMRYRGNSPSEPFSGMNRTKGYLLRVDLTYEGTQGKEVVRHEQYGGLLGDTPRLYELFQGPLRGLMMQASNYATKMQMPFDEIGINATVEINGKENQKIPVDLEYALGSL